MDIPYPEWVEQMANRPEQEGRILCNIRAENCIDSAVVDEFINRLKAQGEPTSPIDAWEKAKRIVWDDPACFQCKGKSVNNDSFKEIFHLCPSSFLKNLVHEDDFNKVCIALGISTNQDFSAYTNQEWQAFKTRLKKICGNRFQVGIYMQAGGEEERRLVWVTDLNDDKVKELVDGKKISDLLDCLGINVKNRIRWFMLQYKKNSSLELRVPRVFDAIDKPLFKPTTDCSASHGLTIPLSSSSQGLPEAVHRGSRIDLLDIDIA